MRVLQVMAGAEKGGAETAFVDMCVALAARGVTQHVVTRANDTRVARLRAAGIDVTTLPFGGRVDIFTPLMMRRIIKKFAPDIVQTWMSRAADKTPGWSGKTAKRYYKICRLGGYYKLKYFRGADHFVTITPDIKKYLIDNGIAEKNGTHINNFAEVDAPKIMYDRADYDVPEEACLIVTLGRLHTSKAFDTLIRAVSHVPDVYVWIGGDGPEHDALQTLVRELGLSDRVRFLGWVDDRAALLEAGDICVFPSRYEPFGTVFVQAWASKIPLITSDADGPRQFVHDGIDGLMFAVDDVDALAAQIVKLKSNRLLQEQLIVAGYDRYKSEFTVDQTVDAYMALYQKVIGS